MTISVTKIANQREDHHTQSHQNTEIHARTNRKTSLTRRIANQARNAARHGARERQTPRLIALPALPVGRADTEYLLALVVRPEAAERVGHLAHPRAGDAVEEPARAGRAVRLRDGRDHALVPRGLQAHFCEVQWAVECDQLCYVLYMRVGGWVRTG